MHISYLAIARSAPLNISSKLRTFMVLKLRQNKYYFTNMSFFHKILNASSLNINEVRITKHFAKISSVRANNEF